MNPLLREQFSPLALCSKCGMHKPWRDFLNPWTNSIELDCSFCRGRSLSVCRGWSFSSLIDPSHAAPSSYPHLPPAFAAKPKSVKAQGTMCVPQARCRVIISSSSRIAVHKATVVYHRTVKLVWSLSLLSLPSVCWDKRITASVGSLLIPYGCTERYFCPAAPSSWENLRFIPRSHSVLVTYTEDCTMLAVIMDWLMSTLTSVFHPIAVTYSQWWRGRRKRSSSSFAQSPIAEGLFITMGQQRNSSLQALCVVAVKWSGVSFAVDSVLRRKQTIRTPVTWGEEDLFVREEKKGDWRRKRHYSQRSTLFPLPLSPEKASLLIILFISFPLSTLNSLHL